MLLKGGHAIGDFATDVLLTAGGQHTLATPRLPPGEKHGSGCGLSAAVLARPEACRQGKAYTAAFLSSNDPLLGYHFLIYCHENQ